MSIKSRRSGVDLGATLSRVRRLLKLDTTVFDEVRDDSSQTVPALLVLVVATLLAALGGWLWLIIEFDGLDTGKIIIREFLIGSIFSLLAWGLWMLASGLILTKRYGHTVDRHTLLRTAGFAAAPLALTIFMLIPEISLGVGLFALVAWFLLTNYAMQAAVRSAAPKQIALANVAGFAVFAIVLAVLASGEGLAPGVFTHGADIFEFVDFGDVFGDIPDFGADLGGDDLDLDELEELFDNLDLEDLDLGDLDLGDLDLDDLDLGE